MNHNKIVAVDIISADFFEKLKEIELTTEEALDLFAKMILSILESKENLTDYKVNKFMEEYRKFINKTIDYLSN